MNDRFSLLFVCSGNRFRSPMAAGFIRRLTLGLPVSVASAGTIGVVGKPALGEAQALAAWSGISLADHTSCRFTHELAAAADLVLGFEHAHVTFAVIEAGCPRDRVFTLPDLTMLLAAVATVDPSLPLAARARERVRLADELRSAVGGSRSQEVADPFGKSRKVAKQTAAELRRLCSDLAERLFDVSGHGAFPDD
jgi:low molecular weight protein-tyrosine phosphatase